MPRKSDQVNAQYRYTGDGAGIPGLPHLVTEEEARRQGVLKILQDALKAGVYQEIGDPSAATEGKE